MPDSIEKSKHIAGRVVAGILLLLVTAVLVLQIPAVQTGVARKALASLTERLNGRIELRGIHIEPFNTVVVSDVILLDDSPVAGRDTVLHAGNVTVKFALRDLISRKGSYIIKSVSLTDGLFSLVKGSDGRSNLSRIFGESDKKETDLELDVHRVKVEGFRFRMTDLSSPAPSASAASGIDFKDLDLIASLDARRIKFHNGELSVTLEHLEASEKSGCSIDDISADVSWRGGVAEVRDLKIKDARSDIEIPEFTLSIPSGQAVSFTDDAVMSATIRDSHLDSRTLASFLGESLDLPVQLDIQEAQISGPINDLSIRNLKFRESNGIGATLNCDISGITDMGGMYADFDVKDLSVTVSELQALLNDVMGSTAPDISKYGGGYRFNISAKGSGTPSDILADLSVSSAAGSLSSSARIGNLTGNSPISIKALLDTKDLNVGEILGIDAIKQVTLHSSADAVLREGAPQVSIDTLSISRLNALDYDYTGIAAAGDFQDNAFNGRIICSDPNLHFIFQGLLNLSQKDRNALYKFYVNLGYADLNALNIDKRGSSKVSFAMDANYMRIKKGDLIGSVDISGLYLENDFGGHNIGDIAISSHSADNLYRVNLNSSFAEASYVSNKPVTSFPEALGNAAIKDYMPVLYNGRGGEWSAGDEYSLDLNFFDSHELLNYVLPGLYIAEGSTLNLGIDGNGILDATVNSQRIAMEDKYLKGLNLVLSNRDNLLSGELSSDEISISSLLLYKGSMLLGAADNKIDVNLSYDNTGTNSSRGGLSLSALLDRDADGALSVMASTLPSKIYEGGSDWTISPAVISYAGGDINIEDLRINGGEQSLIIDGGFSKENADTLNLDIGNFDLGIVSQFIKNMDLAGIATGHATLTSPVGDNMGLILDMVCDSTYFNGKALGQILMSSNWNDQTQSIDARLRNLLADYSSIDVSASYAPDGKNLDATAVLDGFDISYFDGIIPDVFSEMSGLVSGTFKLNGPVDNLSISSSGARLNGAKLRIAYTNVPYYLNGPFLVTDSGVNFNDVSLRDSGSGSGRVIGGISFDHLKDIGMDLRFIVENVQAFDTGYSDLSPVYGQLYATGNIAVTGPFSNLLLNINATTVEGGQFHISLGNTAAQNNADLLTFKEAELISEAWVDPYETYFKSFEQVQKQNNKEGDLGVRLNVNVSPQTQLLLELDKEASSSIACYGQGNALIDIAKDIFTINGDYTLNSGSCHLGLLGVASRDFSIQDGSSIKFNGDIMDSDLDIDAVYSTKASLAGLIADTTSVGTRRTVNCTLNIHDKLSNPQLGFAIDIPDIDPTTRASVESALNTEDKIQKQFVALLVGNSFIPDQTSGIVSTSNMLYSNVAGLMATQLSNILQRLNIPLDLGLKYEPNEGGTDIFDVAISTELFNNRVVVNGSVGNRAMYNNASNSDVVGDLDIEVKLNRSGAWRLTLFSHSADQFTNYLDDSQRNGFGMAYQKEFNTFKDFWNTLFRRGKESAVPEEDDDGEGTDNITFSIEQ